jgi:hypothetical protein
MGLNEAMALEQFDGLAKPPGWSPAAEPPQEMCMANGTLFEDDADCAKCVIP